MSILAINAVHHIGGVPFAPITLALRAPTFLPPTIFETHLTWWIATIALGAILLFAARSRASSKLLRAGQGLLVLALVWIIAARFATPGERLQEIHETLAAATARADATTIVGYMDQSFAMNAGELVKLPISKENAREALTEIFKEVSPKEIHIRQYKADLQASGTAQSLITVFAKLDLGPTLTTWRLGWTDRPGEDWRMTSVTHVSQEKTPGTP